MIDLGTRLELFVDHYLIETLKGARLELQRPWPAPLAPGSPRVCYTTVFRENGLYRRYQREVRPGYRGEEFDGHPGELTTYCESRDGQRWTRPQLGLHEVGGRRDNNVVLAGESMGSHNFTPFVDLNPAARPAQRYKALGGVHPGGGVFAWTSPDGLRWRKLQAGPVLTSRDFAFDSQNVAFWSAAEGQYVCYFRSWRTSHGQLRTISRTTSADFRRWSRPVPMDPNLPGEHLYTSNTHPYFRAPHLYLALPTRFVPERGASTDILFMSSRAGSTRYDRLFTEAFIPPGLGEEHWGNRSNYAAWNVVPTGPEELSIYVGRRRLALRTDGFVALRGPARGGELLTKPFRFAGRRLLLNAATSAAGALRAELRDAQNRPLPGFRLRESLPFVGDQLEATAAWKAGADLGALAGTAVRLRLVLEDASVYSLRFGEPA